MRGLIVSSLLLAAVVVSSAQAQPVTPPSDTGCRRPESGTITDGNPLRGPFLVRMLQTDVDPAAPRRGFVYWSRASNWFAVDEFRGPFYLAQGETIIARSDWTPRGAIYSGCRLN